MNKTFSVRNEKGAATLFVSVIILVIMTLAVLYAARVGVLEQRISSNDVRYKEAFAIADGGLDYATQLFSSEFKRLYDGTDATTSANTLSTIVANSSVVNQALGGGTFTVNVADNGSFVYTFVSTGTSADGSATAQIQRQVSMSYIFGGSVPDVPLIVGGAVGTGGNFNISTNPNGGGDGIPVSIWSSGDIVASSSSATCQAEFYDGNNAQCSNPSGNVENISTGSNPATTLTAYSSSAPDLLPNDSNFPPDLFDFTFGLTHENYLIKKNEADANGQLVSDCSDLVTLGANAGNEYPLWWVDGDCTINGGTIGSESSPVILVVQDHALSMTGNSRIYGLVYLFDTDQDATASPSPSASLGGTTEIQGSFISEVGGSAMSGSYSIVYNPNLIAAFSAANGSNYSFSYVPASWKDF